jgi:hypothetical protein
MLLSDVAPDGVTTFVSGAGLAGAQRESMRNPTPLTPGVYDVYRSASRLMGISHGPSSARGGLECHVADDLADPYAMTTTLELGGEQGSRMICPCPTAALPAPILSRSAG